MGAILGAKPGPFARISWLRSLKRDARHTRAPVGFGDNRLLAIALYDFMPFRSLTSGTRVQNHDACGVLQIIAAGHRALLLGLAPRQTVNKPYVNF
jgi:hypothetical protein